MEGRCNGICFPRVYSYQQGNWVVKYGCEGKMRNVEHVEVLHDGSFLREESKSSPMPPLPKTKTSTEAYGVIHCMEWRC